MAPILPVNLATVFGQWGQYVVYFLIGIGFGAALELSGFGNSKKLAAQFYFKEMTVLKVMFTAIIVAMVLVFASSAIGILDFNLVWVNPTYLWPGIVGGLIMGVGFIVGGFCPGTSVVSAVTGKLDGILFFAGVLFGIFLFGETVGLYEDFWYSSYMGRFTLMELFNVPAGVVVFGVVLMALAMFFGSELAEKYVGGMDLSKAPKWRYGAAAGLAAFAAVVMLVGQPTAQDFWARVAPEREAQISEREVQAHPGEVLELMFDPVVRVEIVDVRSETDYNYFHILDSVHIPYEELESNIDHFQARPDNQVFIVASNDEQLATEAWRTLVSYSIGNVYILEGGVNGWIETFDEAGEITASRIDNAHSDMLQYDLDVALGDRYTAAGPNPFHFEDLEFEEKVELQIKRGPIGSGCGS